MCTIIVFVIIDTRDLTDKMKAVLKMNDRGDYTIPAAHLYEHQWLWDSCFIALGLSTYNVRRAQSEILRLLKGQWSNGMMPNMIFSHNGHADARIWQSKLSPFAPEGIATSGITQPPLLAEAIYKIGQRLKPAERRMWYRKVYPALLSYHTWLYRERDPHHEGLITLIHPWESGLDNSPVWTRAMHDNTIPWWIRLIDRLPLEFIINRIRKDTRFIRSSERSTTLEILVNHHVQQRLRAKAYNSEKILLRSHFQVQDLAFNSILIRNNQLLFKIAQDLRRTIPESLRNSMKMTVDALQELWDPTEGVFFSRNFITHQLIDEPSIMTFMPLYAGIITSHQKDRLVELLKNKHWNTKMPVPSVPTSSGQFSPTRYWQGPTWVNTNWLIIDGLLRCGEKELAKEIAEKTLAVVAHHGSYEYFNPLSGDPLGAQNFSWTAALCLELLSRVGD